jgi:hypothetical protein
LFLTNGFPEQLMAVNEVGWVNRFIDSIADVKGAVTAEVAVYAGYLRDPAHLRATLAWFRTWPGPVVRRVTTTSPRDERP